MLHALLRGKLSRQQENMEDVLTSNVFGLLSYLPPQDGLFRLLAFAESYDPETEILGNPLKGLADAASVETIGAAYEFWPFWNEPGCISCEPDVVLRLNHPSLGKLLVAVEAKYRSGKSTEADDEDDRPRDQLARQWDNLIRIAEQEEAVPILIYLTTSLSFPKVPIQDSVTEFIEKRPEFFRLPQILHLSWRHIPEAFGRSRHECLRDLCDLCRRLGQTFFHGLHLSGCELNWEWRFNRFPVDR